MPLGKRFLVPIIVSFDWKSSPILCRYELIGALLESICIVQLILLSNYLKIRPLPLYSRNSYRFCRRPIRTKSATGSGQRRACTGIWQQIRNWNGNFLANSSEWWTRRSSTRTWNGFSSFRSSKSSIRKILAISRHSKWFFSISFTVNIGYNNTLLWQSQRYPWCF